MKALSKKSQSRNAFNWNSSLLLAASVVGLLAVSLGGAATYVCLNNPSSSSSMEEDSKDEFTRELSYEGYNVFNFSNCKQLVDLYGYEIDSKKTLLISSVPIKNSQNFIPIKAFVKDGEVGLAFSNLFGKEGWFSTTHISTINNDTNTKLYTKGRHGYQFASLQV